MKGSARARRRGRARTREMRAGEADHHCSNLQPTRKERKQTEATWMTEKNRKERKQKEKERDKRKTKANTKHEEESVTRLAIGKESGAENRNRERNRRIGDPKRRNGPGSEA